jgi:predicted NUDIX family NTP pyrophosphohydrolase
VAEKASAGILLYRIRSAALEVFLVHPGGPFWMKKDEGAWSIPKGEIEDDEDLLESARREFHEETGSPVGGDFLALQPLRQRSGKLIHAWAVEGDIDAASVKSNLFSMEWPPNSGTIRQFPEVDRAEWFAIPEAQKKLLLGQRGFLDELTTRTGVAP